MSDDQPLSLETVYEATGIAPETILRWIRRGMPHQFDRPGKGQRTIWFTRSALLRWLERETRAARPEPPTPSGPARLGPARKAISGR